MLICPAVTLLPKPTTGLLDLEYDELTFADKFDIVYAWTLLVGVSVFSVFTFYLTMFKFRAYTNS